MTSCGVALLARRIPGAGRRQNLVSLGETLGEVVTMESVTMVTMVTMEASKTATEDDVEDAIYNWFASVFLAQWHKIGATNLPIETKMRQNCNPDKNAFSISK